MTAPAATHRLTRPTERHLCVVEDPADQGVAQAHDLDLVHSRRLPRFAMIRSVLREMWARPESPRVNEPDLLMDSPQNVQAYIDASREGGVMDPV